MVVNKCQRCGNDFQVKPYRKDKAKYCSYDCYWQKSEHLEAKACSKCGLNQSLSCFHKNGSSYSSQCKTCRHASNRKYRRKFNHKEKYRNYIYRSITTDRELSISYEEFLDLVTNYSCYYCGLDNDQLGLDRVDNSQGYTLENVVPCCRPCNVAKNDMSYNDFITMCKYVVSNHDRASSNSKGGRKG